MFMEGFYRRRLRCFAVIICDALLYKKNLPTRIVYVYIQCGKRDEQKPG